MLKKSQLEENLETLDFRPDSPEYGLLFVNAPYKDNISISFGERLVLRDAKLMGASAVYFRRADRKETLPQLFVFDNTGSKFSEEALVQVHKKIWTSGIVPLYYVFDKTSLRVFDAKKPAELKNDELCVRPIGKAISLIAEAHKEYKRYSAELFENGSFWEQKENKNRFLHNESSINYLIRGLKNFKQDFNREVGKDYEDLADKLLVQSILVKYLEELRDEDGNPGYKPDFFTKYDGAKNFCDVIRKGKLVFLFEELGNHFNGKIFELSETEEETLRKMDLSSLADFLDANITTWGQYVFWRLYEFSYLPVEVISRIYEEFLADRSDAVYTPVHLAKFMVDECMPVDDPKKDFKVIDVSCGSGVFLVTVFRRLAQWRQLDEYTKTREIKTPDQKILKELILNSIYGVDIEENAIRLAAFSLSIALCEMLTPMQIWKNLKFDDLTEKNLHIGDFFKYLDKPKRPDFDLVIGNPPFSTQDKSIEPTIKKYSLDILCKIPQKQKAILFLEQAMKLLRKGGLLSLVMPSGPLLYNSTSAEYRKRFFERYTVPQITDFTHLSPKHYLFERNVGTAVIFALNSRPEENHNVLHITVRRSKSAKERLYFEIDHYDLHWIPQEIAASDPVIWKADLFGGGQLYYLIKQLMTHRTLKAFLREKEDKEGWACGEGYILGNKSKKADWLTGRKMLETKKLTADGITETTIENEILFEERRKKNRKIFDAPHLLIREILGNDKFIITTVDYDLIFKHQIVGIHAPEALDELKKIELFLQKNYKLLKVFLSISSSRSGIVFSSSTLLKKDFMSLPYPENESELKLFQNDQIIIDDFLKYLLEAHNKGESAKINILEAKKEQLNDFADVFCRNLNSVYEEDGQSFHALEPIKTDSAICFPFAYGKEGALPSVPAELKDGDLKVLLKEKDRSAIYNRVLYFHQPDMVYMIKPKKLRYWLKSVALRDVPEVMSNFVQAGF